MRASSALIRHSSPLIHHFFQRFDLGEVALLVQADEGEPLVEVERPPGRVREVRARAVHTLDARAQGVDGGARVAEGGQRVGERRAGRAYLFGRGVLLPARALDELRDGDGRERGALFARGPRLKLAYERAEHARDAPLRDREVLDQLRDSPPLGRRAEGELFVRQVFDRADEPRARVVYGLVDFGDAVVYAQRGSLLWFGFQVRGPSSDTRGARSSDA